jgi:hypothetical protein
MVCKGGVCSLWVLEEGNDSDVLLGCPVALHPVPVHGLCLHLTQEQNP